MSVEHAQHDELARLRAEVERLRRLLDAMKRDGDMVCEMLDDPPRCGECDACALARGDGASS